MYYCLWLSKAAMLSIIKLLISNKWLADIIIYLVLVPLVY